MKPERDFPCVGETKLKIETMSCDASIIWEGRYQLAYDLGID